MSMSNTEKIVKGIRRKFSTEEKMRIVLDGLRGESSIAELWQTDFTYFRVIGRGWHFLSMILDDYSRYIITWRLTTTMAAADVTGRKASLKKRADWSKRV